MRAKRTVRGTLSNKRLHWRLDASGALHYWKLYGNPACTELVAVIPANCVFDADGVWFKENA